MGAYPIVIALVANTGLSVKRNGDKLTASWKIKTKNLDGQYLRYRYKVNGKWTGWSKTKKLGKKTTSWSITPTRTSFTAFQVEVQAMAGHGSVQSEWTSYTYTVEKPPAPGVAVTWDRGNNATVFTVTSKAGTTDHKWQKSMKYRTKYALDKDREKGWGAWTAVPSGGVITYPNDAMPGFRQLQVIAIGPAGESAKSYGVHYVGFAPVPSLGDCTATPMHDYYRILYVANISGDKTRVDEIHPQYVMGVPDADLNPPSAGWERGETFAYNTSGDYKLFATTDSLLEEDQCLWGRVETIHDGISQYSDAVMAYQGKLKAPAGTLQATTPTVGGFDVSITGYNINSEVPGVQTEVYLEKQSTAGELTFIGIYDGTTLHCGEDVTQEETIILHARNAKTVGTVTLTSDYIKSAGSMPNAPTIEYVSDLGDGKVEIAWKHNWDIANGSVISWSDDPIKWMSNDPPDEFAVEGTATKWYITGLDTGKTWYFRVRSTYESGDTFLQSPWSQDDLNKTVVKLEEVVLMPSLYLSDETISKDETVTAYWASANQISAEVWQGSMVNNVFTPSKMVGATVDERYVDIPASIIDLGVGEHTTYLALKITTPSGDLDFSEPVILHIAPQPVVIINTPPFDGYQTQVFDGDGETVEFEVAYAVNTLQSIKVDGQTVPATASGSIVTLDTAPADGATVQIVYDTVEMAVLSGFPVVIDATIYNASKTVVSIVRSESYPIVRPDGRRDPAPAGEVVYSGESLTINLSDLGKPIDDGAYYYLTVRAVDDYGQSAEDIIEFVVDWNHQAWVPSGTVTIQDLTARITPQTAEGYREGDTCDIYRLSKDAPELIYKGAEFGVTYVDPFPAFGEQSGYKIVTVTAEGDYITQDDEFAEFEPTYDKPDPGVLVIDYLDFGQVILEGNLTIESSWSKDFKRTPYLGGSVVGDYNNYVLRDSSVGTALARNIDEQTIAVMHEIGAMPRTAHVRTPDGSSFEADVQVTESRAYNKGIVDYSLTCQKVDTSGYDAMTQADWEDRHGLD